MNKKLMESSLDFHKKNKKGKIEIHATKSISTRKDLTLAYTPGVAFPCIEISRNNRNSYEYTSRGNLIAVVSNGTAVLGLGDIGAFASKPVMEGKAIIFKKFSGIDAFDIEINEKNPDKFINIVSSLEPTFGGINLEDIKSPDCFYIEKKLQEKVNIPIFHDDQHGTAIVVAAAVLNWIEITGRDIRKVKLVVSGAGAAAISCTRMLEKIGIRRKNVFMCDSKGVIHSNRKDLNEVKSVYAVRKENLKTLSDVVQDADIFLGCSVPKVLTKEMVQSMSDNPIILALSNPIPEILPSLVEEARSDAIICTGRSDYPNQVNNILCFPFIFRGALDVQATEINDAMKIACIKEISKLAKEKIDFIVYEEGWNQGYLKKKHPIIPNLFDPRLIMRIAPAVAKAAMISGVAKKPIENFAVYKKNLRNYVREGYFFMRSIFLAAKRKNNIILLTEGESEKILYCIDNIVHMGLSKLIIIGRKSVIKNKIKKLKLKIRIDKDFSLINLDEKNYEKFLNKYFKSSRARKILTKNDFEKKYTYLTTLIGSLYLYENRVDGMICCTKSYNDTNDIKLITDIVGFSDKKMTEKINIVSTPNTNFFISELKDDENISVEYLKEMISIVLKKVSFLHFLSDIFLPSLEDLKDFNLDLQSRVVDLISVFRKYYPSIRITQKESCEIDLLGIARNKNISDVLLFVPKKISCKINFDLLKTFDVSESTVGSILVGTNKPVHICHKKNSVQCITNTCIYLMA
ncbi:phosphate acyltransferase [Candidatus Riesia pediculischaeffi]|nr:phosphate acyltransferase [Candidatus Riesia pediculischaeffi]